MFELEVKDVFKITGRGYVIAGEIISRQTALRNGDILFNKANTAQRIYVKSIEMVNFGDKPINLNKIGILSDISEEEALGLIGERLFNGVHSE